MGEALEQFYKHLLNHVVGVEPRPQRFVHEVVHLVLVAIEKFPLRSAIVLQALLQDQRHVLVHYALIGFFAPGSVDIVAGLGHLFH
jgi:hypothetical protein